MKRIFLAHYDSLSPRLAAFSAKRKIISRFVTLSANFKNLLIPD
ncbi:hypothetical protein V7127_22875 [Bacillus sp. JJ1773]